jgi:hypothetical protein
MPGACISRRRGVVFLFFCGPKTGSNGPFDLCHFSQKSHPPWTKTAPAARPGAMVSAAPPVAPPRGPRASPDHHPTWWLVPPGAHHGPGAELVRLLGAPTKSRGLTKLRPEILDVKISP